MLDAVVVAAAAAGAARGTDAAVRYQPGIAIQECRFVFTAATLVSFQILIGR